MGADRLHPEDCTGLVDVVYGIVVAVSIMELPVDVVQLISGETNRDIIIVKILLRLSTIVFATCYWIEVRQYFRSLQSIMKTLGVFQRGEGFGMGALGFMMGSLLMIVFVASHFAFAGRGDLRAYLVVAICFWTFDLGGSLWIQMTHRKYREDVARLCVMDQCQWYRLHVFHPFFIFYGLANIILFSLLWYVLETASSLKVDLSIGVAVSALAITVIRHGFFRSSICESVRGSIKIDNVSKIDMAENTD